MKLLKKNDKKAFTLLEVMLATAVGLVASTMMVEGLISAMQYTSNTKLYARFSEANTGNAAYELGVAHGNVSSYHYAAKGSHASDDANLCATSTGTITYDFSGDSANDLVVNVNLYNYRYSESDVVRGFNGSEASGSISSVASANRHVAIYTPMESTGCTCGTNEHMRVSYDPNEGVYFWFCDPADGGCNWIQSYSSPAPTT